MKLFLFENCLIIAQVMVSLIGYSSFFIGKYTDTIWARRRDCSYQELSGHWSERNNAYLFHILPVSFRAIALCVMKL